MQLRARLGILVLASCTSVEGLTGHPAPPSDAGTGVDGAIEAAPGQETDLVDDAFPAEFGAGTFAGTRWVGDHVELETGKTSGDFTSRVFDSRAEGAAWKTLQWTPGAPYAKPLPDMGQKETGYKSGALDMDKNVVLLHLDGAITDTSPSANTFVGSIGSSVPGIFGTALSDPPNSYIYSKVTGAQSPFNFGTDSFTWSMWVKSTTPCPGNAVYMGIENPGTGLKPHLWFGCTRLGDAGTVGTVGDTFCSTRVNGNDCADVIGDRPLTDGNWHHMAIVKSGHSPATITAYLDGALLGVAQQTFSNPIVFDTDAEFAIGGFSNATYPAEGVFDEVAVWRRALSQDEVVALLRRGALRMSLQVRACGEPTCASATWVGPKGDPALDFTDPPGSLAPPASAPVVTSGRFVQYRVHFESAVPAQSPALYAVAVTR